MRKKKVIQKGKSETDAAKTPRSSNGIVRCASPPHYVKAQSVIFGEGMNSKRRKLKAKCCGVLTKQNKGMSLHGLWTKAYRSGGRPR
jgi:hypothetical protein